MLQSNAKKRVLVTGGAKRLGAAICLQLAKAGFDIVIHYNKSEKEAKQLVEQCQRYETDIQIIKGNFDTYSSLEQFISSYKERFDSTFALINNVGNYLVKSALDTTYQEWESIFQNNLHVPFMLSRSLVDLLKKQKGAIVNIGVAGSMRLNANTYATAYALAKNSLYHLTKSFAKELAGSFVRVNMISPGHIENSIDLYDTQKIPMHRAAHSEEVAKIILFLLSPESEYVTGQNIEVAGGYLL